MVWAEMIWDPIEPITSKNRLINYFRKNFQSQFFRRQIRVSMNSFIQANITVLNDGQFLHCRGSKWFVYRKGAKSAKKNKNMRFSYFVINTHRPKISGKTAKEQNIAVFRIVLKQSLVRKRPKNQKWTELLTEKSLEKIGKKRKFSEF